MKIETPETVLKIIRKLQESSFSAMVVGGAIRDCIMGKEPKDWDLATSATPAQIKELFPDVIPVGESHGVVVIVEDGMQIQIATLRRDGIYSDGRRPDLVEFGNSIEEDSKRRDFTCNAMFFNPITGKLYDFHQGQKDIEEGFIRAVGNANFRIVEDKLRMLRAVRFAVQLDFYLSPQLAIAITEHSKDITDISWERISDELLKILSFKGGIETMDDLNLLHRILPELSILKGVQSDPVYHGLEPSVFDHCVNVANTLRDSGASPDLILIGLLHDIGKVHSHDMWLDSQGRVRHSHIGHEDTGAISIEKVFKRLKLSNELTDKAKELVSLHMKAHLGNQFKKSNLIKFLRHEHIHDIIALQSADAQNSTTVGKDLKDFYLEKLEENKEQIKSSSLINGDDLIAIGLTPGPRFKEILTQAREWQDSGEMTTKEEILTRVKAGVM